MVSTCVFSELLCVFSQWLCCRLLMLAFLRCLVVVIQVHFADGNLFKMSLRALGNLSYCDENIRCGAGDSFVAALM